MVRIRYLTFLKRRKIVIFIIMSKNYEGSGYLEHS